MTATDPQPQLPRFPAMTVRGWFRLVFAVIAVLLIAASIIFYALLTHGRAVSRQLDSVVLPAQAQAYRLQESVLEQQNGVRGYGITGERSFLAPYTTGQATESSAAARLTGLLDGAQPMAGDLRAIQRAVAHWRASYAAPLIAAAAHGPLNGTEIPLLNGSEQAFNQLNRLFATQNTHLAQQVTRDSASIGRIRAINNWTFTTVPVIVLIAAIVLALILSRAVLRPLNRLRASARQVVNGDFDQRIEPTGPADLRAVTADIEAMRSSLVAAVDGARSAQEFAASQAADLDGQAAELMRSNAELEQFAYVASHDLQEPLRKVASFCQLLERRYGDQLDDRGRQYIDFAVDGAKRLQVLINDLLTFSRVGRGNEIRTELSLDQPLDAAIGAMDAAIEEKGAVIERPAELPEVMGDPTLLAVLWQNLISNGIKFAVPDRAPVIKITSAEAPDDMWKFCVADNGIGISPEFSDKIFIIFQRLHGRDAYPGTGIGLALCKRIVEHHGGEISLDPDYSGGTQICFTLPRIKSEILDTEDVPSSAAAEGIPA
jgi:signal transduction histidine kinase